MNVLPVPAFPTEQVCLQSRTFRKRDCCSMDESRRKHNGVAQSGPTSSYPNNAFVQGELYRIPKELVR